MLLNCSRSQAFGALTCLRCSQKLLSASTCKCCICNTLPARISSASKVGATACNRQLTTTTTTTHLIPTTGVRSVSTGTSLLKQPQLRNTLFCNKWTTHAASANFLPVFPAGTKNCIRQFSSGSNGATRNGSGEESNSPKVNTNSNEVVDAEVKDWLKELRDDFQKDNPVPKFSSQRRNEVLDEVENIDDNGSSSSSDSDTDSQSSSDSELDGQEITEFEEETSDAAKLYADSGKFDRKRKPNRLRDQVLVTADINEHSQLYAEVSEYAKRINREGETPSMADEVLEAHRHWSKSTITIEEFPDYKSDQEGKEKPAYVPPIPLTRGVEGVFDLDDLVILLNVNNARDCGVIKVPKEHHYVDYLVLVTAKSLRHNNAMAEDIQWIYKRKKGQKDPTLRIEKGGNWTAMDLGNIALHMFLPEARENYDIETLWTCGEEFDEKSQETEIDQYAFLTPPNMDIEDERIICDQNTAPDEEGEKM